LEKKDKTAFYFAAVKDFPLLKENFRHSGRYSRATAS